MEPKLRRPVPRVQYLSADKVAAELGHRLGLTPGTAHQVLVGSLAHRCAEVIRAHVSVGAHDRLYHWLSPINDALDGTPTPTLSPRLMNDTARVDAADDPLRIRYINDKTDDNARALSRAYGHTISHLRTEQLALGAKHGFAP